MSKIFSISEGLKNNLPSTKKPGRVLLTTDEQGLYYDKDSRTRIDILANPKNTKLSNEDLDTITIPGLYYGGAGNTVTNKPESSDAFGLIIYKASNNILIQEFTCGNGGSLQDKKFYRRFSGSSWGEWGYYYSSLYPQTTITGNAGSATKLATSRNINGINFNGTSSVTNFCICDTAADVNPKIITLSNFSISKLGATISIKFTNGNTASPSPLILKINGINAQVTNYGQFSYLWQSNSVVTFVVTGINASGTPNLDIININNPASFNTSSRNSIPLCKTGNWTPSLVGMTNSIRNASGHYFRVGSYVHCRFSFAPPTKDISDKDSLTLCYISGLPFAIDTSKHKVSEMVGSSFYDDPNVSVGDQNSQILNSVNITGVCVRNETSLYFVGMDKLTKNDCIIYSTMSTASQLYNAFNHSTSDSLISGEFSYFTSDD